jgi:hypothetical protein
VTGSAVGHVLSGSTKRVMGLHALAGVGSVGTPVGASATATSLGVNVPSQAGGLVLDVLYGNNATQSYNAGSGQIQRWQSATTGGPIDMRGSGSSEGGAPSVTMSWTTAAATNLALMAISFIP